MPKNWCFQTVLLEKTLESPLNSKEIKPVIPKGNQPCIFVGRTDGEGEGPILWPPDVKKRLSKRLWCWERWGQEERGRQKMRWLDSIMDSVDMSLSKLREEWGTGKLSMLQSIGLQRLGHNWATEQQFYNASYHPQSQPSLWTINIFCHHPVHSSETAFNT